MIWLAPYRMNPKTYIVDFFPTISKETPSQLRKKEYADNLLSTYDLGEVIVCTFEGCKQSGVVQNPDIIICTNEYSAQEIKILIPEAVLYVAESVNSVFSRKNEMQSKIDKNNRIFEEASCIVERIRQSTDEERASIRKFASMDYNEMYKMLQKALISDDEKLKKSAWDLLFGEGERHSNLIWMRVQMMAEMWDHTDWKGREQLMLMSMERHIDQGTARKMDNFTDEDGLEYYQYMFLDPFGKDTNHIRRLPFATKGQDKYAYENLLEKNEIPTNYLRIQVETNSVRKHYDDYIASECVKVQKVLDEWEKDKTKGKKELGVGTWNEDDSPGEPLKEKEVEWLKNFLKNYHKI
jgi:hypothetical protein